MSVRMPGGGSCLSEGTSDCSALARNQAVRIPVELELPGHEAVMHRDGDRLVIEPVRKRGLVALLQTMKALEELFPKIEDPVPTPLTCGAARFRTRVGATGPDRGEAARPPAHGRPQSSRA